MTTYNGVVGRLRAGCVHHFWEDCDGNKVFSGSVDVGRANALMAEAADALDAAEAQVTRLTEALRPFSEVGRIIDSGPMGDALFPDKNVAFSGGVDANGEYGCRWAENGRPQHLNWGHFRRARAALSPSTNGAEK